MDGGMSVTVQVLVFLTLDEKRPSLPTHVLLALFFTCSALPAYGGRLHPDLRLPGRSFVLKENSFNKRVLSTRVPSRG